VTGPCVPHIRCRSSRRRLDPGRRVKQTQDNNHREDQTISITKREYDRIVILNTCPAGRNHTCHPNRKRNAHPTQLPDTGVKREGRAGIGVSYKHDNAVQCCQNRHVQEVRPVALLIGTPRQFALRFCPGKFGHAFHTTKRHEHREDKCNEPARSRRINRDTAREHSERVKQRQNPNV